MAVVLPCSGVIRQDKCESKRMQSLSKVQALVVGLGNPGSKYERTRHNVGFRFIDYLTTSGVFGGANALGLSKLRLVGAGWSERFEGLYAEAEVEAESLLKGASFRVALLKPQTFMNLSGASVGAAVKRGSLKSWQVFVCHDELDIPFGEVRSKRGGGEAGHNGLKSISQVLGTRDYHRIRLGIGRPDSGPVESNRGDSARVCENTIVDWVLGRFSPMEENRLSEMFDRAGVQLASGLENALKSRENP